LGDSAALPTREKVLRVSRRYRQTLALEVAKQDGLVTRRPSVVIPIPTDVTSEYVTIQREPVTLVPMRPVLIRRTAYVALRHEFALNHTTTSRFLTPNY